jgi:putative membrane protein
VARSRLRDIGTDPDPRFSLANERTYLAWNRTALALIGAGIAAWDLLDIGAVIVKPAVALVPIALGGALAAQSYGRWRANEVAMRRGQPLPRYGAPLYLAAGLGALALVVAGVVVVDAL